MKKESFLSSEFSTGNNEGGKSNNSRDKKPPVFEIEEENPDNLLVPTLLRQALRGKVELTEDVAKRAVQMAIEAITAGNDDYRDLLNAILKLNSGQSLSEEEAEMIIDLIAQALKREKEGL